MSRSKRREARRRTAEENKNLTWKQVVENVLIASLARGQFPVAIAGLVAVVIIWKMPSGDVSKLAFGVLDSLIQGQLLGYAMMVMAVAGWFTHVRWQRRMLDREMRRVSAERNRIQEAKVGLKLPGSDRK